MLDVVNGTGLVTVTQAVVGTARLEAGIDAVSCEPLTKVVGSELPFHLTSEPVTKPVPLTVSTKPDPPGAVVMGTSGLLISGTGFP